LGDSLDDTFRFMVLEKCTVKSKAPGTMIAHGGKPMDGMYILGGGTLEVLGDDGSVEEELRIGDFVFPETVLSASPARRSVRVGKEGALVVFSDRMSAHELLATCPPFIELIAGEAGSLGYALLQVTCARLRRSASVKWNDSGSVGGQRLTRRPAQSSADGFSGVSC